MYKKENEHLKRGKIFHYENFKTTAEYPHYFTVKD